MVIGPWPMHEVVPIAVIMAHPDFSVADLHRPA